MFKAKEKNYVIGVDGGGLASFLNYFLKRETDKFFTSIVIRGFALGMINIFVPIYIYQHFGSLSLALLFFAAIHGLLGLTIPFGGELMEKIGIKHAMLISFPFTWGYYLCLLSLDKSILFIPLAIVLCNLGNIFFWPAFHTDFARFAERKKIGGEVGKLNFFGALPGLLAPTIGGAVIVTLGYPILFIIVLIVLFSSAIPLFLSKEIHQIYTDSYFKAYRRVIKKENKYHNLAFASRGIEGVVNSYLWPLFLIILAIGHLSIGAIATVAAIVSLFFKLGMGKITDKMSRKKLLAIGSILTSGAWIGKFFVVNPISAFLAQSFYGFSKTVAETPFQAIWYKKAKEKGPEVDEFIVYRDIVLGLSRCFSLIFLAGLLFVFPIINIAFIIAAVISLGFMFLGKPPKINLKNKIKK